MICLGLHYGGKGKTRRNSAIPGDRSGMVSEALPRIGVTLAKDSSQPGTWLARTAVMSKRALDDIPSGSRGCPLCPETPVFNVLHDHTITSTLVMSRDIEDDPSVRDRSARFRGATLTASTGDVCRRVISELVGEPSIG